MNRFIGRDREIDRLNLLLKKKSASLVAVKGRRRIGKSRLVEEFGENLTFYRFSGLAPVQGITAQVQRDAFADELERQFQMGKVARDNWADLFWHLADQTKSGKTVILLDEVSWMADKDATFVSKLKNAWDLYFKKNNQLILVLCSSISVWIEENIISSTAFFGRLSLTLHLQELSLHDCNKFWGNSAGKVSAYEKFKVLSVTGGVPRYLEEIIPAMDAEAMLRQLCFEKEGILFKEFDSIFSDLFSKRSEFYKHIVLGLLQHPLATLEDVYQFLKVEKSGKVGEYLNNLIDAGFLRRYYTWSLSGGKKAALSRYRISDNYLRFYLKYILPNADKIKRDALTDISLGHLPGWETMMGLQFENLVINNRQLLLKLLHINPADVVNEGPFFQTKTKARAGVQIDYLIQTKYNSLYLCEIKFSKNTITKKIVSEVANKIDHLVTPRNMSLRPVLIHVNGVQDSVVEEDFFTAIVDFSELLG